MPGVDGFAFFNFTVQGTFTTLLDLPLIELRPAHEAGAFWGAYQNAMLKRGKNCDTEGISRSHGHAEVSFRHVLKRGWTCMPSLTWL